jgi:hypothetical protein
MMKAVRAKFQIPALKAKLLATGNVLIRVMSPQDNFWGVGRSGKGKNKLGKILMRVREELAAAAAVEDINAAMLEMPAATEVPTEPPTEAQAAQATQAPEVPEAAEAASESEGPVIDITGDVTSEIPMLPEEARTDVVAADGSNISAWDSSDNIKVIKY